jgi:nucleoside-diphosphate-sugar epimerase
LKAPWFRRRKTGNGVRLLLTGAGGEAGRAMLHSIRQSGRHQLCTYPPIENYKIDRIIHAAGRHPSDSPAEIFKSNALFAQQIVDYGVKRRIPELIFFSSVSVYGDGIGGLVTESTSLNSFGLYPATKVLIEAYLRAEPISALVLRIPGLLESVNTNNFMSRTFDKLILGSEIILTNASSGFNGYICPYEIAKFVDELELKKEFDVVNLATSDCWTLLQTVNFLKEALGSSSKINTVETHEGRALFSTRHAELNYGFSSGHQEEVLLNWINRRKAYRTKEHNTVQGLQP